MLRISSVVAIIAIATIIIAGSIWPYRVTNPAPLATVVATPAVSAEVPLVQPTAPPEAESAQIALPEAPAADPLPTRYISIHQFRAAASAVGWADADLDPLTRVALCESGLSTAGHEYKDAIDVEAESAEGDAGPMQISRVHSRPGGVIERLGYQWQQMYVLVPNLRVALALHAARGWVPWACQP